MHIFNALYVVYHFYRLVYAKLGFLSTKVDGAATLRWTNAISKMFTHMLLLMLILCSGYLGQLTFFIFVLNDSVWIGTIILGLRKPIFLIDYEV